MTFFLFYLFLKKFLFIYLTARERTQAGGAGEGEVGSPLSRAPDVRLDRGSWYHDLS